MSVEVYTQHHFEQPSSTLFQDYFATFFDIKKEAAEEGNVGLKEVAKLMINAPTGKHSSNISWERMNAVI